MRKEMQKPARSKGVNASHPYFVRIYFYNSTALKKKLKAISSWQQRQSKRQTENRNS